MASWHTVGPKKKYVPSVLKLFKAVPTFYFETHLPTSHALCMTCAMRLVGVSEAALEDIPPVPQPVIAHERWPLGLRHFAAPRLGTPRSTAHDHILVVARVELPCAELLVASVLFRLPLHACANSARCR